MTDEKSTPRPPRLLGKRGRAMWRTLWAKYDFDPHETDLVVEVCRTLDTIEDLSTQIDADGTMITGSTGQQILHPAIGERRQEQASYGRLVQMLNLPAADGGVGLQRADSARASAASNARWRRRA
jgi:hypothetical protein